MFFNVFSGKTSANFNGFEIFDVLENENLEKYVTLFLYMHKKFLTLNG